MKRKVNPALCLLLLLGALLITSPAQAAGLGRNYKEVYRPPAGQPARGAVLLLHGGGWASHVPALLDFTRPFGRRLARWGYVVWMVDYRSGAASLKDAVRWYRRIRAAYPGKPLCANGQSAGGHLALWVAVKTPLRCVIDESGPTDLTTATVSTIPSFFPSAARQRRLSPLTYAGRAVFAGTRILVAHAIDDPVVPYRQSLRFHHRQSSRLVSLPSGDQGVFWVHSAVDSRAFNRYLRIERGFLDRAMRAQLPAWRRARPPAAQARYSRFQPK